LESITRRLHCCLRWKTRIMSLQPKTRSRQEQPNGFFRCKPNNKEKVISRSRVLQTLTASRNFRARGRRLKPNEQHYEEQNQRQADQPEPNLLPHTHAPSKTESISGGTRSTPSFELTQIDWRSSAAKGNFSYQAKSVGTEHSEINSSTND
jgi:hypothetical protein